MKKNISMLVLAIMASLSVCVAQSNIVIDDFETGSVTLSDIINVNPPAHMTYTVVANPVSDSVNSSSYVWKWERYDAGTANQPWAGFYATLTNPIPSGYHRIDVKYLRTNSTSQLRLKVEGSAGAKEIDPINPATLVNNWEVLSFDIHAEGVKTITILSLFPDYYSPVDPTAVTYVDDITVVYDSTIVEEEIDTIFHFTNSADNRYYDQSWVSQTTPSVVTTENWQEGEPNGDKLPVVTSPSREGNALKLQWTSTSGGDWMALVAALNWAPSDASQMSHVAFWLNTDATFSKANMPKLFFEATSGTPNQTGSVNLSNYMTYDLAANTWTKIVIPLADIWAAKTDFAAKDVIKGLFFAQNATDNTSHTLYIDDVIFYNDGSVSAVESVVAPQLLVYYNQGNIYFSSQVESLNIYDISGRAIVSNKEVENSSYSINLNSGIYLIQTNLGTTKLYVK